MKKQTYEFTDIWKPPFRVTCQGSTVTSRNGVTALVPHNKTDEEYDMLNAIAKKLNGENIEFEKKFYQHKYGDRICYGEPKTSWTVVGNGTMVTKHYFNIQDVDEILRLQEDFAKWAVEKLNS